MKLTMRERTAIEDGIRRALAQTGCAWSLEIGARTGYLKVTSSGTTRIDIHPIVDAVMAMAARRLST